MASNVISEEPSTSGCFSSASLANPRSFQNSSMSLDSEVTLESSSDCFSSAVEADSLSKFAHHSGGGITCVPNCYNNSKRNKELSFYVIPKDHDLRKK